MAQLRARKMFVAKHGWFTVIGKTITEPIPLPTAEDRSPSVTCKNCGTTMNLLNPFGKREVDSCDLCKGKPEGL